MKLKEIGFNADARYLVADIKAGLVPALLGVPGIGKSSYVQNLVNTHFKGSKLFTIMINELSEKTDLTGARVVKTGENEYDQLFFPHVVIKQAIKFANEHPDDYAIVFYDEFNRTEADVISTLFTTLTARTIGSIKLPDNVRFIVAGNDAGDVRSLNVATSTRLAFRRISPELDTLLAHTNFLSYIVDTLKDTRVLLVEESLPIDETEADDSSNFLMDEDVYTLWTNPRTIEYLDNRLRALGLDGTVENDVPVLEELLSGRTVFYQEVYGVVGKTAFSTVLLEKLEELVDDHQSNRPSLIAKKTLNTVRDYTNTDWADDVILAIDRLELNPKDINRMNAEETTLAILEQLGVDITDEGKGLGGQGEFDPCHEKDIVACFLFANADLKDYKDYPIEVKQGLSQGLLELDPFRYFKNKDVITDLNTIILDCINESRFYPHAIKNLSSMSDESFVAKTFNFFS